MPVVLRIDGLRFLFYSNEGRPREPPHVHVLQIRDEAKFWLAPEVSLAYNDGLSARQTASRNLLRRTERGLKVHA